MLLLLGIERNLERNPSKHIKDKERNKRVNITHWKIKKNNIKRPFQPLCSANVRRGIKCNKIFLASQQNMQNNKNSLASRPNLTSHPNSYSGKYNKKDLFGFSVQVKGAASRLNGLKNLSLNFSILLFVIRVNLLHPYPPLFLYGLLLSI